jgi:hypothetical protein
MKMTFSYGTSIDYQRATQQEVFFIVCILLCIAYLIFGVAINTTDIVANKSFLLY